MSDGFLSLLNSRASTLELAPEKVCPEPGRLPVTPMMEEPPSLLSVWFRTSSSCFSHETGRMWDGETGTQLKVLTADYMVGERSLEIPF